MASLDLLTRISGLMGGPSLHRRLSSVGTSRSLLPSSSLQPGPGATTWSSKPAMPSLPSLAGPSIMCWSPGRLPGVSSPPETRLSNRARSQLAWGLPARPYGILQPPPHKSDLFRSLLWWGGRVEGGVSLLAPFQL